MKEFFTVLATVLFTSNLADGFLNEVLSGGSRNVMNLPVYSDGKASSTIYDSGYSGTVAGVGSLHSFNSLIKEALAGMSTLGTGGLGRANGDLRGGAGLFRGASTGLSNVAGNIVQGTLGTTGGIFGSPLGSASAALRNLGSLVKDVLHAKTALDETRLRTVAGLLAKAGAAVPQINHMALPRIINLRKPVSNPIQGFHHPSLNKIISQSKPYLLNYPSSAYGPYGPLDRNELNDHYKIKKSNEPQDLTRNYGPLISNFTNGQIKPMAPYEPFGPAGQNKSRGLDDSYEQKGSYVNGLTDPFKSNGPAEHNHQNPPNELTNHNNTSDSTRSADQETPNFLHRVTELNAPMLHEDSHRPNDINQLNETIIQNISNKTNGPNTLTHPKVQNDYNLIGLNYTQEPNKIKNQLNTSDGSYSPTNPIRSNDQYVENNVSHSFGPYKPQQKNELYDPASLIKGSNHPFGSTDQDTIFVVPYGQTNNLFEYNSRYAPIDNPNVSNDPKGQNDPNRPIVPEKTYGRTDQDTLYGSHSLFGYNDQGKSYSPYRPNGLYAPSIQVNVRNGPSGLNNLNKSNEPNAQNTDKIMNQAKSYDSDAPNGIYRPNLQNKMYGPDGSNSTYISIDKPNASKGLNEQFDPIYTNEINRQDKTYGLTNQVNSYGHGMLNGNFGPYRQDKPFDPNGSNIPNAAYGPFILDGQRNIPEDLLRHSDLYGPTRQPNNQDKLFSSSGLYRPYIPTKSKEPNSMNDPNELNEENKQFGANGQDRLYRGSSGLSSLNTPVDEFNHLVRPADGMLSMIGSATGGVNQLGQITSTLTPSIGTSAGTLGGSLGSAAGMLSGMSGTVGVQNLNSGSNVIDGRNPGLLSGRLGGVGQLIGGVLDSVGNIGNSAGLGGILTTATDLAKTPIFSLLGTNQDSHGIILDDGSIIRKYLIDHGNGNLWIDFQTILTNKGDSGSLDSTGFSKSDPFCECKTYACSCCLNFDLNVVKKPLCMEAVIEKNSGKNGLVFSLVSDNQKYSVVTTEGGESNSVFNIGNGLAQGVLQTYKHVQDPLAICAAANITVLGINFAAVPFGCFTASASGQLSTKVNLQ